MKKSKKAYITLSEKPELSKERFVKVQKNKKQFFVEESYVDYI
jgi:hypothetical protein